MIKPATTLIVFFLFSLTSFSQVVVQINAGSRASWGTNQDLFIESNGRCRFYLTEVNGGIKDSSSFFISTAQLDSFFKKADEVGFFSLNTKYADNNIADGAGIFISMNYSGKRNSVELRNTDIPQVNQLITLLNAMLKPKGVRIYYGQK